MMLSANSSTTAAVPESPTVAVLALQGAFVEHERKLTQLGCKTTQLRQKADLQQHFDALVLPGGESTVQAKLLHELEMFDPLQARIASGLPVLGTCAGLILLAQQVQSASDGRAVLDSASALSAFDESTHPASPVNGFRTLPITVLRNGYGRQLGSFVAEAVLATRTPSPSLSPAAENSLPAHTQKIPLVCIRAPRITALSSEVQPLIMLNDEPVAVQYNNQIGCTFHPELTDDDTIYRLFLKCFNEQKQ
ncbi:pyridoxal 5'-phosphate synthase glutaminase subunit PdxT [Adlercreutzia agrestimuris]|uniref:pyridoxal 5'-phosphate synthase glutaminase subunit PdxT n=1 Tax=Adlercreutzia agrestimuris TaxID=2941324 RepID=UPI002041EB90|nr:Type 1 glutamine amidotransferase-like domain-containing protein [Adlercreutzia agrestimuris]